MRRGAVAMGPLTLVYMLTAACIIAVGVVVAYCAGV